MLEKNEIKNLLRLFTQKKYQAILDLKVYLIDSYPNSVNIHNILGLVHYARKECREAIVCFSEAIKLSSDFNAEISYNLAITFIEVKDFNSALTILKSIEHNNPNYKKVYFQIGITYFSENSFQDA
ncbi:hypothetical protein OAQ47_06740, partial [Paracoccaceae bacterium]|nr:hypothetical protein [Paracoccaceae bacterium]